MANKSDLLNTINANAEKHETEVKTQYLEMADKFEKAFVSLHNRSKEIQELSEVAHAYFTKDPNSKEVRAGSRIILNNGLCGRNGYGKDGVCAIGYVSTHFTVAYYPDGEIHVGKTSAVPLMFGEDVTPKVKEIRDALKACKNEYVVRISDNNWVYGWSVAEAIISINKHFDELKENLTKAVKHEGDENMVIWRTEHQSIRIPRLTKEEIEKIQKFVTETPPTGDACSKMFNQLIRFAREVFDAQEAG